MRSESFRTDPQPTVSIARVVEVLEAERRKQHGRNVYSKAVALEWAIAAVSALGDVECPTNHKAPNNVSWSEVEWFICEGGEDFEKWVTQDGGATYRHCPDCGASLRGENE